MDLNRFSLIRAIILIVFLITNSFSVFSQNFPFTQRRTWDGPFDIKMVSSPNLQPVFIDNVQAEKGGTSQGYLLADSLISDNIIQRTGSLFEINNRYKDGSSNSVFAQYNIPMPALLCKGNPNLESCNLGLDLVNNNSSCPAPNTRYNSSPLKKENTYVAMSYADYDNDLSTFSSSMASLDVSTCSEIETAYLYWSGNFITNNKPITMISGPLNSYNGNGANVFDVNNSNFDKVRFKVPGGNYQMINATTRYTGTENYVCVADVTNLVQGVAGGEFWVADLRSYPIEKNGGSTSGWTLVVVFKSPLSPPRTISLWDGFKNIAQNKTENFTLSGLQTPASNNFKSYVGFAALDGENLATQLNQSDVPEGLGFKTNNGGANFSINPFETDQAHYKLYHKDGLPAKCDGSKNTGASCREPLFDANWCEVYDGLSSSHITTYDETTDLNGNEILRLPNNKNTLGYDAHHMKLPNGAVAPNASEATLTVSAGPQGSTMPFLAYLAIERLQPKLVLTKTADKNASALDEVIRYNFVVKNEGNAASLGNDHLFDTLDLATKYVVNSLVASRAGISLVSSANERIDVLMANPILPGDSVILSFDVRIIPFASNPSLFSPPLCKRTIENTAFLGYRTPDSGVLFTKSNSNDCGIGSETRVLLIDAQLTNMSMKEVGSFDACDMEGEYVRLLLEERLIDLGYSLSTISKLDFRDSKYNRVRQSDLLPKVEGEVEYFAINEAGSSSSCQEQYRFVFKCEECSVHVISLATASICTDEVFNYQIIADSSDAAFKWSRASVVGVSPSSISNQTSSIISEQLTNTSLTAKEVIYNITPVLDNCVSVPFELKLNVFSKPIVTDTNISCLSTNSKNGASGDYYYQIDLTINGGDGSYTVDGMLGNSTTNKWSSNPILENTLVNLSVSDGNACVPFNIKDLNKSCKCNETVVLSANQDSICVNGITNSTNLKVSLNNAGNAVSVWNFALLDKDGNVVSGHDYRNQAYLGGDNLDVSNVKAGTYQVVGLKGTCEGANSNLVVVSNYQEPSATILGKYSICDDFSDVAQLQLNVNSALLPAKLTIARDGLDDTIVDITNFNSSLNVGKEGDYTLSKLVDSRSCEVSEEDLRGLAEVVLVNSPIAAILSIDGSMELGFLEIKERFVIKDEIKVVGNALASGYLGAWNLEYFGLIEEQNLNQANIVDLDNPAVFPDTSFGDVGVSKLFWIVIDESGICDADSSIAKIIRVTRTLSAVPADKVICSTELPYSIAGNKILSMIERSYWIDIDGAKGIKGDTIFSQNVVLDNFALEGNYRFEYIIENQFYPNKSVSDWEITIVQNTSEAYAGEDLKNCNLVDTLKATQPLYGVGFWKCDKGVVAEQDSSQSLFSGLNSGEISTCIWTIENGVCPSKQDEVLIEKIALVTPAQIFIDNQLQSNKTVNVCIDNIHYLSASVPNGLNGEQGEWFTLNGNSIAEVKDDNPDFGNLNLSTSGKTEVEWRIKSNVEGCTDQSTKLIIDVFEYPKPVIDGGTLICITSPSVFSYQDESIFYRSSNYLWFRDSMQIAANEVTLDNVKTSGEYSVRVDNGVCPIVNSNVITLDVRNTPQIDLSLNKVQVFQGEEIIVSANHTGSSFMWTSSSLDALSYKSNTLNQTINTKLNIGDQTMVFHSYDGPCSAKDTLSFRVKIPLSAPNVFTVNGDGINETFKIKGLESFDKSTVSIFNRWGGIVYESNNYVAQEWDGGTSPEGVYYYVIDLGEKDKSKHHTGVVHLVR